VAYPTGSPTWKKFQELAVVNRMFEVAGLNDCVNPEKPVLVWAWVVEAATEKKSMVTRNQMVRRMRQRPAGKTRMLNNFICTCNDSLSISN